MRTTTISNARPIHPALLVSAALCAFAMGACKLTSVTLGSDGGGHGGSGGGDGGAPSYRIGTAAECPADLLHLGSTACALPSDVVCAEQHSDGGWAACNCGCESAGQWSCISWGNAGPLCPLQQPAQHGSCSGFEGAKCSYFPETACECGTTTHVWSCGVEADAMSNSWKCLSPSPPGSDPPGIDPTKTIATLTDAEAQAWCTWFVTSVYPQNGAAPPPDRMVSADGTVSGYAALACNEDPFLCVERLSIDHCVANLKLDGCSATVRQLDDCVHTLTNDCKAVGQGCDAYIAAPSCGRTIVTAVDQTSGNCKLPVQ